MKFRHWVSFFLAFAVLTRLPLAAADTIEIKQLWLAGKKYYQSMQMDQKSTFEVGGEKIDQATVLTIEVTMAIAPPQNGQPKTMTMRYERVAMEMNMNGQKMSYDSAQPDANSDPLNLGKTMGSTVGQELKVTFNDRNEIADIQNYDEFIEHIAPSPVPGFDPRKSFSRESLVQMMKQGGLHANPGKPVAPGDAWPFDINLQMPQIGNVGVKGIYTLKAVGDHEGVRCAEIGVEGTINMDLGSADASSPLSDLGMKLTDASMHGSTWFDPQLGIARESQLVQEMTISMKDPADASATIEVPTKQTVSVKLTKVEDLK